jgi:hypothetical protein
MTRALHLESQVNAVMPDALAINAWAALRFAEFAGVVVDSPERAR